LFNKKIDYYLIRFFVKDFLNILIILIFIIEFILSNHVFEVAFFRLSIKSSLVNYRIDNFFIDKFLIYLNQINFIVLSIEFDKLRTLIKKSD